MIHDDGTPHIEQRLPDTDIDAFLDKVDTDYEALPVFERRRLLGSVQQAQREITRIDEVDYLARHLNEAELFDDHVFEAAITQVIAEDPVGTPEASATVAEVEAREIEKIALKTLRDACHKADLHSSFAVAGRDEEYRGALQAEQQAATTHERSRHARTQAERDAAILRDLAQEEAGAHKASVTRDHGQIGAPTRTNGLSPTFAQEVRRLRNERGLSLSRMTELVPYSKGHLSKIENGLVLPNLEMARLFDNAFQTGGRLIELASAPVRPIPSDDTTFLTYESMLDHHRALGDRLNPEVVLMALRPQVDALSSLAGSADNPGVSRGLWLLAARYAEYAGWMEQERGDQVSAAELTKRAVHYAAKGGDHELEAYALVRAAEFALYREDARAAVALARRASKSRSIAVQAVAAQREAQGYALAGAAVRCQDALDRAEELQRTLAETRYGTTSPIDQVAIARAWSFHDLGRYAEAAAILDIQVPLIPAANLRARTRFGLRRALAHAEAGDVDYACELVTNLLDDIRQVQSATIHIDLTSFSRLLSRLRPATGREIAGEIDEILFGSAPSPSGVKTGRSAASNRIEPTLTVAASLPASSADWSIEFERTVSVWVRQISLLSIG